MKKSELKTGMVVETRRGELATVMKNNCFGEDCIVFSENNQTELNDFDEDTLEWYKGTVYRNTLNPKHAKSLDIMKVYLPRNPAKSFSRDINEMELIWEGPKRIYNVEIEVKDNFTGFDILNSLKNIEFIKDLRITVQDES